jgi:DNA-binding MarR family transcriptional regulator
MDEDGWRAGNVGRLLNRAVARFEARVLALLAQDGFAVRPVHLAVTRNLDFTGTRATDLAQRAAMTKQGMGQLIDQCEADGLVFRDADPLDGRAKIVRFTPHGRAFMASFRLAVGQAEAELRAELGPERAAMLLATLAEYCAAG